METSEEPDDNSDNVPNLTNKNDFELSHSDQVESNVSHNDFTDINIQNIRKSSRITRKPTYLDDFQHYEPTTQHLVHSHALSTSHKSIIKNDIFSEPKSYEEASGNPLWVEAMKNELQALEKNQT